jgi:hypothetical protein
MWKRGIKLGWNEIEATNWIKDQNVKDRCDNSYKNWIGKMDM